MSEGRRLSLLLIGLGTAIAPLDTALNVAFPAITRAFALKLPEIQWLVVTYVLTYAVLLLAMGRIGDLAGHRAVFRLGLGWSAAALALCALAPSYPVLLAARVAQGIGTALVLACGPALLTGLYREGERARALGVYTMMFSLAAALGPILGGALVAHWGWPAVFWFRVPLALAALLPERRPPPTPQRRFDPAAFDLPGAVLLALALAGLLLAIGRLGALAAGDPVALLLLGGAAAAFLAFIRRERRRPEPLIDLSVFSTTRGFAALNLGSAVVNGAGFAVLLLAPYYLARIAEISDTPAGALLAVSGLGAVAGSPLAARLGRRLGARAVTALGALISALGLGLVALIGDWRLFAFAFAVQGFGLGLFQVAYMDRVTAAIARGARGVAGSLALLTRTLGIVLGAALLTLAYGEFQSTALAAGTEPRAAFVWGFRLTFACAAAAAAAVAAIEGFRRR
jgi:MFS family permease